MPSESVQFLTVEEGLAIYEGLIARFGGRRGVRDLGLLESALYRPQTGYYADLAEMAAALFESLIINHPFVDGYKRVSFFATGIFFRMNGWKLRVDSDEAHRLLIGLLERGECDLEHLIPWIRASLVWLAD